MLIHPVWLPGCQWVKKKQQFVHLFIHSCITIGTFKLLVLIKIEKLTFQWREMFEVLYEGFDCKLFKQFGILAVSLGFLQLLLKENFEKTCLSLNEVCCWFPSLIKNHCIQLALKICSYPDYHQIWQPRTWLLDMLAGLWLMEDGTSFLHRLCVSWDLKMAYCFDVNVWST